jgi:hypothetical protein
MWVKRNDRELWRVGVTAKSDAYITGVVGDTPLDEIRATAPAADKPAASAPK